MVLRDLGETYRQSSEGETENSQLNAVLKGAKAERGRPRRGRRRCVWVAEGGTLRCSASQDWSPGPAWGQGYVQAEDKGNAGQAATWGAGAGEPRGWAGLCTHRERDWLLEKGSEE